jgi:hypothetical protein
MATAIRIGFVVLGFALFVVAEILDNIHENRPDPVGPQRADKFMEDAQVFTLRIFGAFIIGLALLSFVIARGGALL